MAQFSPPFYLTYIPPAAPLPSWLKYTSSPIATSTLYYTVETLLDGTPTVQSGAVVVTKYLTQIIQLPLTVDVPYKVAAPYTNAGGTGPTVVSILGATGSGATFVLAASVVSAATPTAAPFPTPAPAPQEPATTAPPVSASTGGATPFASSFNNVSASVPSATNVAANDPSSASNTLPAPPTSTIPELDSAAFPATPAQSDTPNSDSASSPATPQPAASSSEEPAIPSPSTLSPSIPSPSTPFPSAPSPSITSNGTTPPVAMLTYMTDSEGVAMLTFVNDGTSDGLLTLSSSTSTTPGITITGPATAVPRSLSSQLNGGEIAGIVIGCLICAFLVLVIFVLCFIRRRREKRSRQQALGTHNWEFAHSRQVPSEVSPVLSSRQNSGATTGESGSRSERFLGILGIRRGSSRSQEGTALYAGDGNESFGGGRTSGPPSIRSRDGVGPMMREVTMGGPAPMTPRRGERGTLLGAFHEHLDTSSNEYEPESRDQFGAEPDGYEEYSQRGFGPHHQRSASDALVATSMLKGLEDDWQPNSPTTPLLVRNSDPNSFRLATPPRDLDSRARKPAKRRPVSEMGWLSGRGSIDPSTASSRESSVPTFGSRTSGSGSSGRAKRGSKGLDVPSSRSASVGNISREGSRGVSFDHSPNLSELFYDTPRWTGGPWHTVMGTPPRRMVTDDNDRNSPYRSPYRDIPYIIPSQDERHRSLARPATSGTGAGSALLDRIAAGWGSTLSGLGLAPAPAISARQRERSRTSSAGDHSLMDPFASHGMMSPSASAPLILDHQSSPSRSLRRGLRGPREPSNRSTIQGRRSLTFGEPIQVPPVSMAGSISDFNHTTENASACHDSESENGIFADAAESGEDVGEDGDEYNCSNHRLSMGGSSIYGGLRSGTPHATDAEDDLAPRPYRASQLSSAPRSWTTTIPDIRDFRSLNSESLNARGVSATDNTSQGWQDTDPKSASEFGLKPHPTMSRGAEYDPFIAYGRRGSTSTSRSLGPGRSPSVNSGQDSSPATLYPGSSPQTGQTRFPGGDELNRRNTLGRGDELERLMIGKAL